MAKVFWFIFSFSIIIWYAIIMVIVAIKGYRNITDLIARKQQED